MQQRCNVFRLEIKVSIIVNTIKNILLSVSIVGALVAPTASAERAPDFVLQGPDATVSLSSYRGRVVYVDFWASWCTPCRKSFPWMNAMQRKYEKYGFAVVALNLDADRRLAEGFLEQTPAEFVIAFDPSGTTAEQYKVDVMPSSYLVDRQGDLVAIHKGFRNKDAAMMEQQIRQLLRH
jgi:thiol-disulfide isomerase/thioredoxin